jgi:hypothetical protein
VHAVLLAEMGYGRSSAKGSFVIEREGAEALGGAEAQ